MLYTFNEELKEFLTFKDIDDFIKRINSMPSHDHLENLKNTILNSINKFKDDHDGFLVEFEERR